MVRRMEKWTAPKKGWYKVNSDGGFRKESGNVGIRVVVRNVKGVLVDGYSGRVKADNELVVEAMTVRKGIKLVLKKKFQKMVVEMDSKIVYDEIVNEKKERN